MADSVTESAIKQAVKNRRDEILSSLETMTLKKCRQQLEEDMGLEPDALKPHKDLISNLIDKVIARANPPKDVGTAAEPSAAKDKKAKGKAEKGSGKAKLSKGEKVRRTDEVPVPRAAAPRQYSKKVVKLRNICKEATITIPPSLYAKNKTDDELESALEQLLEKQGLAATSGKEEIANVKKRLMLQRDLDGIDTSNIIEDGGRRRRQAAATPVNYRQMLAESDEEEGSDQESESSSEASSGSEPELSEEEAGSNGKRSKQHTGELARKRRATQAGSEEGASGSEVEEEGYQEEEAASDEEGHNEPPPPISEKSNPDENKATDLQPGLASQFKLPEQQTVLKVALDGSSDDEMQQRARAKKQRRVVADWSDDE